MMILMTEKRSVTTFLLAGSLLLVTGCFHDKKDEEKATSAQLATDRGDLLLSIDGKPVLYAQDFEDQKAMALQTDPRLGMMLQVMPNLEVELILASIEGGKIIEEWVKREKLDQDPTFAKTLRQYQDAIYTQLCLKAYQDAHPLTVTDQEAKEFYDENKNKIQGLVIVPAGFDVLSVKFNKKDEAERFTDKIKDGSKKNFEAAAKEFGFKVVSMVISEEGYADEAIKNSVLSVTKFPAKEMVKIEDGSYVVLGVTGKKDAEYHSFDHPDVKKGITKMCMDAKREKTQLADIEKMKKEYNVIADRSYFEKKAEKSANIQKSLQDAQNLAMVEQQPTGSIIDEEDDEILFDDKI